MKLVPLKMPEDLLERLDGVAGNRSEVIRTAIEEWLDRREGADDLPRKPAAPRRVEAVPVRGQVLRQGRKRDWSGDFPAIEAVIAGHRYGPRDIAAKLGWADLRVDKVLSAMEAAGKVRIDGGIVVLA